MTDADNVGDGDDDAATVADSWFFATTTEYLPSLRLHVQLARNPPYDIPLESSFNVDSRNV